MTVYINGTTGYSGPVGTIGDLTTTGNTTLGDASSDTLTLNGNTASIPNGLSFTNGNIGVGVTPSAWTGTAKVLEFGNAGNAIRGGASDVFLTENAYFSSGWKYGGTGGAAMYNLSQSAHYWYTAPSGTAGNAITFTTAMLLDTSGNLGLGFTPSAWGSANRALEFSGGGIGAPTAAGYAAEVFANCYYDGTNWVYKNNGYANRFVNYGTSANATGAFGWFIAGTGTAGNTVSFTQAMTLNTSGNLGLGVTPNAWASVRPAIQLGPYGTNLSAYNGGGGSTNLSHNAYHNGTDWIRQIAFNSALYTIDGSGTHYWYSSGTGAAGSTISFTNSMTLTSSNVLSVIGGVSTGQQVASSGNIGINMYGGSDASSYTRIRSYEGTAGTNISTIHFFSSNWNSGAFESSSTGAINVAGGTGVTFGSWNAPDASINTTRLRVNGDRYLLSGPNSGWGKYIQFGGGSRYDSNWASVITTNGNLHIDSASSCNMYLNYYSGNEVGVYNGLSNGGYGTIKAAAFTVSSDYRLKENVVEIADGALASVLALSPKEYDLAGYDTRRFYGFLAHELAEHLPITVVGKKDAIKEDGKPDYQGVEYMQLVPVLVKALQELKAEFDVYKLTHP